jgi:UDP-N-acetylglucosamine acyltransferase
VETGIHPSAVVHETATLGSDVFVGPFCVVGAQVKIGDRTRLASHVVIEGPTDIGPDNVISPMASLGGAPQDLKYDGEPTRLEIGSGNKIREYVTISRGTVGGGGVTSIGDGSLFMAQTHVGHDCQVGSRIIFGNAATLAGHVEVGDDANVGAYSGVHQFCRVARFAFIGGYSVVTRDALPWVLTVGNRAKAFGLNTVGLKRKGYAAEVVEALKSCYQTLFRSKTPLEEALATVEAEFGHIDEVRYFVDFVRGSERGVCR